MRCRTRARGPPIRNDPPAHSLVRVSIVRIVPGHRHGTVFHVSVGYNPPLGCSPSRILIIRRLSECVCGRLLICLRRGVVHLRSWRASQRLRSVWIRIHRRWRPASLVKPLGGGSWRRVIAVVPLRWRPSHLLGSWWWWSRIWASSLLLLEILRRGNVLTTRHRARPRVVAVRSIDGTTRWDRVPVPATGWRRSRWWLAVHIGRDR